MKRCVAAGELPSGSRKSVRRAWYLLALGLLTSCTSLPNAGPSSRSFNSARWEYTSTASEEGSEGSLPFVLVNVDRKVVESLAGTDDLDYFKGAFTDQSPPSDMLLGPGDTLRITIFEAGPGGLFVTGNGSSNGGNYVTLPDQEVDQMGRISIPYAGKNNDSGYIKVTGRRVGEVQNEIQQKLMNKAIEPQVMVTTVKRSSNMFSVMGDVNSPGRFSLDQSGLRMLDALSMAGGPRSNDYNTLITLQRGKSSATARLSQLLRKSENNIFVQPNDLLAVKKDERYYNVLGATHNNNRIAFEAETVTVADAIAKAGGLNSEMAEPATVVVFRREELKTLDTMGVKLEGNQGTDPVPVVYRFNLTEPTGMFFAQKMQLHNNDVVYVSTHAFNDAAKLLSALRDVLLIKLIGD